MPNFIRPDADLVRTGHSSIGVPPAISTGASVFGVIGEATNSDADFVTSNVGTIRDVVAVGLGNPATTPAVDVNHFLRVRAVAAAAGRNVGFQCELRQGYASESSLGTYIATCEGLAVPTTSTRYRHRLTPTEAALITDYTDLQLRFLLFCEKDGASSTPAAIRIVYAELEVPDINDRSQNIKLTESELRFGVPDPYYPRGVRHAG